MKESEMLELIERHIAAEMAGDTAGAVAVYTDDVVHDTVGFPTGPLYGPKEAQGFYEFLTTNMNVEVMDPVRSYFGEDFTVMEHQVDATVPGEFLGVVGNGRKVNFRMLHVWDFQDGKISRENIWLDGGTIVAQLTGA